MMIRIMSIKIIVIMTQSRELGYSVIMMSECLIDVANLCDLDKAKNYQGNEKMNKIQFCIFVVMKSFS